MQLVSITSQGQITIPAKMRKKLKLDKGKKAWMHEENGKIVIRPTRDLTELGGILHDKAITDKPIEEVMKMEQEALKDRVIKRYLKKQARS